MTADSDELSVATPPEFQGDSLPLIATEAVPRCPVCDADRFHALAAGYDYESLTCRNRWRFVRCGDCGHAWLGPRPATSELPTIYPPTYYAYRYAETIHPLARRGKEWLDGRKIDRLLRGLGRTPRSYLDVGCGDGRFLRVLEKKGVPRDQIIGLELDPTPLEPLRQAGYRVLDKRVEDCDAIAPRSIDLATMFHVIEHVADPAETVKRIASWLAPGGVLAIETPNIDSLDARLFAKSYWGGYHIPRHWNLFTPESLQRLLEAAGLEILGSRFQTGHSFWMFSIHHWLKYGRRRPRLAGWFNPYTSLIPLMAFTALDMLRIAAGLRTSAILMCARRSPT